jgi:hypothetical protein
MARSPEAAPLQQEIERDCLTQGAHRCRDSRDYYCPRDTQDVVRCRRLENPPLKIHTQKCLQEMNDISSVPRQARPPKAHESCTQTVNCARYFHQPSFVRQGGGSSHKYRCRARNHSERPSLWAWA